MLDGERQTQGERRPCEDRGRVWRDAATSQATPRIAGATRSWGRQKGASPGAFGGSAALPTPWSCISGLQNCERKFLLLYATQFVVICCSRPRTLIQTLIHCTDLGKSLSAGPRFAHLQNRILLDINGFNKCTFGISYVPSIGCTAGSRMDRNPCPRDADIPEGGGIS